MSVKNFQILGYLEGASFLILLGVAMPLKYVMGYLLAVKVVGWIHGLLFILYMTAAFSVSKELNWPKSVFRWAVIAAVFPFGPFIFDRKYLRHERVIARK